MRGRRGPRRCGARSEHDRQPAHGPPTRGVHPRQGASTVTNRGSPSPAKGARVGHAGAPEQRTTRRPPHPAPNACGSKRRKDSIWRERRSRSPTDVPRLRTSRLPRRRDPAVRASLSQCANCDGALLPETSRPDGPRGRGAGARLARREHPSDRRATGPRWLSQCMRKGFGLPPTEGDSVSRCG
jgi:hypothetical protein